MCPSAWLAVLYSTVLYSTVQWSSSSPVSPAYSDTPASTDKHPRHSSAQHLIISAPACLGRAMWTISSSQPKLSRTLWSLVMMGISGPPVLASRWVCNTLKLSILACNNKETAISQEFPTNSFFETWAYIFWEPPVWWLMSLVEFSSTYFDQ